MSLIMYSVMNDLFFQRFYVILFFQLLMFPYLYRIVNLIVLVIKYFQKLSSNWIIRCSEKITINVLIFLQFQYEISETGKN